MRLLPANFWDSLEQINEQSANGLIVNNVAYAQVSYLRQLLGDKAFVTIRIPDSYGPQIATRIEIAFPEAELIIFDDKTLDFDSHVAYRDSLYKPLVQRMPNIGTIFKTGQIEK